MKRRRQGRVRWDVAAQPARNRLQQHDRHKQQQAWHPTAAAPRAPAGRCQRRGSRARGSARRRPRPPGSRRGCQSRRSSLKVEGSARDTRCMRGAQERQAARQGSRGSCDHGGAACQGLSAEVSLRGRQERSRPGSIAAAASSAPPPDRQLPPAPAPGGCRHPPAESMTCCGSTRWPGTTKRSSRPAMAACSSGMPFMLRHSGAKRQGGGASKGWVSRHGGRQRRQQPEQLQPRSSSHPASSAAATAAAKQLRHTLPTATRCCNRRRRTPSSRA